MAEYKAFSPTAWKAFMKQFPEKAGLVVTSLPTATEAMTNLVRFSLETNQWYVCDGTQWVSATPSIPEPDLSAYKKQFNGTLAEWNALSEDEQAEYDSAAIDDVAGAGSMLTGTVEEGNENAVTSDAVAKAIASATKSNTIVNRYYGSRTVSVTTFNRLTIVCASRYPTCAGAWLILNNYSSAPACIELGKAANSTMSVTASVDTSDSGYGSTNVQVTVNSASYEWDIVQIPFN